MDKAYIGNSCIVSSLGLSTSENVDAIVSYSTNISSFGSTPVCTIDRSRLDLVTDGEYTFAEQLCIKAIEDVLSRSGVMLNDGKTAIILSTTKGNVDKLVEDFSRSLLWSLSNKLTSYFGCKHDPTIISTACISGVAAIIAGARMIEQKEVENVYVVGVDIIGEFIVEGFNSFRSISPTICRPYDLDRDGLTAGEGCGVILLTNDPSKSDSGIIVAGGGLSNDANHISGPSRSGDGLFLAIDKAMKEANITAQDVDYINLHGTGTSFNDEMESKALNLAGLTSVPCNSLKPYFGHTFGASGVIETILQVEQMKSNIVYGVLGYSQNGVPFELNVSAKHRALQNNCSIKSASGFGGTNAAIVLCKQPKTGVIYREIETEQLSHIEFENSNTDMNFTDFIKSEYKALNDANLKFFKMDELSKLGYVASCKLLKDISLELPKERIGILLANSSSSSQTDLKHQDLVNQKLELGTSPAIFVYTLPNIVAAEIAIKHKIQGEQLFLVEENKSMDKLKERAELMMKRNICDAVIYGWCELLGENYNVELKLIKIK